MAFGAGSRIGIFRVGKLHGQCCFPGTACSLLGISQPTQETNHEQSRGSIKDYPLQHEAIFDTVKVGKSGHLGQKTWRKYTTVYFTCRGVSKLVVVVKSCYHTIYVAFATPSTHKRPKHSVSEIAHHYHCPAKSQTHCHRFQRRNARVTVSVRRILFSLPSSCAVQGLWCLIFERLCASLPLPSG